MNLVVLGGAAFFMPNAPIHFGGDADAFSMCFIINCTTHMYYLVDTSITKSS